VNENLIIDTLNARKFENKDIDAILAKMTKFKHPLTIIKIKLYEKKQEPESYQEPEVNNTPQDTADDLPF
jgi:hypothetical protein